MTFENIYYNYHIDTNKHNLVQLSSKIAKPTSCFEIQQSVKKIKIKQNQNIC